MVPATAPTPESGGALRCVVQPAHDGQLRARRRASRPSHWQRQLHLSDAGTFSVAPALLPDFQRAHQRGVLRPPQGHPVHRPTRPVRHVAPSATPGEVPFADGKPHPPYLRSRSRSVKRPPPFAAEPPRSHPHAAPSRPFAGRLFFSATTSVVSKPGATHLRFSDDDGRTWSPPRSIPGLDVPSACPRARRLERRAVSDVGPRGRHAAVRARWRRGCVRAREVSPGAIVSAICFLSSLSSTTRTLTRCRRSQPCAGTFPASARASSWASRSPTSTSLARSSHSVSARKTPGLPKESHHLQLRGGRDLNPRPPA